MKKLFFYIVCCALASFVACSNNDDLGAGVEGNGAVVISTAVSDVVTRSNDNESESRVEWIDVFVFDANGNKFHSERIDKSRNPDIGGGMLSISKSRNAFTQGAKYSIYLIANSNVDLQQQSININTLDDLKAQAQEDKNLHLSGFRDADGNMIEKNAPALFLMDGVAHTPSNENQTAIVINDGNTNVDLQLKATIRRAAAKIVININQGEDVEFHHYLEITDENDNVTDIGTAEYTFYQLPISTAILSSAVPLTNPTKQNTSEEHDNDYSFVWSKAANHTEAEPNHKIQLVGYSYAYEWNTSEKMVSLVVNIPMRWNENNSTSRADWSKRSQNWYRIPITQNSKFDRNKLYEVSITVNTAGATSKSSAVVLEDIKYNIHDWESKEISITNSANDPEFLMLNRDTVHIYNANIDAKQLTFSSSSFIPSNGIKVKTESVSGKTKKAIYFYNKFGQKTYLEDVSSSSNRVDSPSTVASAVKATSQANVLNGGITISSKIFEESNPDTEWHFNTIRYIEFEVENEDGIKAEFLVMQYPVIYITNQQGYFSYRDDFIAADGTVVHYQNRRADYLTAAYWGTYKIQQKTGNNKWSEVESGYGVTQYDQSGTYYADGKKLTSSNSGNYYEYTEGGTTYRKIYSNLSKVFDSDVVVEVYTSGTNVGKADLDTYKINERKNGWSYSGSKDPGNQRMYHVHVTATSGDYTVGRPRIVDENGNLTTDVENGQTDDSADNARLVSPSFMIASQLGVTQSADNVNDSNYARAVNQCKNYVETYYDDLNNNNKWDSGEPIYHYRDWRLPTAEEIRIISELQGKTNGAVDTVLAGQYYFCASPQKYVNGAGSSSSNRGYFIRCIRDAY